jgi:replicative DNA helicase
MVEEVPFLPGVSKKRNLLDFCGGLQAIMEIANQMEMTPHAAHWQSIVLSKAKLRALVATCMETAKAASESQAKVDLIFAQHQAKVMELAATKGSTLRTANTFIPAAWDQMNAEREADPEATVGYGKTGLYDVDKVLRGLKAGRVYLVATRPACGKSALAGQTAVNTAELGYPVLVFSLEMPAEEWGTRMICTWSRTSYDRFVDGMVDMQKVYEMADVRDHLKSQPLSIEDSVNLNIQQIQAVARNWAFQNVTTGGLVVIDYCQLVTPINARDPREQQVAQIARGVKTMARELNLPVLLLSQVNREFEKRKDGRLQMSDLRESGALEQDADVILFINPTEQDEDGKYVPGGKMTIDIAKHRGGPTGLVPVTFTREYTRFENYAKEYAA